MKPTTKFVLFVVLLALVGLGIYSMKKTFTSPASAGPEIPQSTDKLFIGKGVSFTYPKEAQIGSDLTTYPWQFNTALPGNLLVYIVIPRSIQPLTNLSDSLFMVGASTDKQALKECLVATNGETAQGDIVINGVTYATFQLSDAAAGNLYDTTSYRTMRAGTCYAVAYTIHSTNIGNYDPNQGISAFDRSSITAMFGYMVRSFTFI